MHEAHCPENDQELNPAPRKYQVSFGVKAAFFALFLLGLSVYFYMIYDRRSTQNKFILENQMAAVAWNHFILSPFNTIEPLTLKPIELSFAGQWTLLNLWATWCAPCREEMPSLELLQQKMGHQLAIVAVSLDDNIDAVRDFIQTSKPSFRVYIDREKISQKLLGVDKYPETFLISPAGEIVYQFGGPRDWSSLPAINYLTRAMDSSR